jgi:hypothetical protein
VAGSSSKTHGARVTERCALRIGVDGIGTRHHCEPLSSTDLRRPTPHRLRRYQTARCSRARRHASQFFDNAAGRRGVHVERACRERELSRLLSRWSSPTNRASALRRDPGQ